MAKTLRTAAIIVGAVALVATGVGAVAGLAGVTAVAGVSAATITSIGAIAGAVSAGLSFAAQAAAGAPRTPAISIGGNQTQFSASLDQGLPWVLGRTRTAGCAVHDITYDANGSTNNALQTFFGVWSADRCYSLEATQIDNAAVTFALEPGGTVPDSAQGDYHSWMWHRHQLGADPEAAALTATGFQPYPPGWSADHRLSGMASFAWTMRFDPTGKVYPGGVVPQKRDIIRGALAWDPRKDSTYPGGSGTHRADQPATWEWTENPFLLGLKWARGIYRNGKRALGIGMALAAIDVPSAVYAANVADANGWKVGGTVYSTDPKYDVLKKILAAGSGEPMKVGGKLYFMVDTPRVSLATITNQDIIAKGHVPGGTRMRGRINGLIPSFRSPSNDWQIAPAAKVTIAEYVTADGRPRTKAQTWELVQDAGQVAELAAYAICNSREIDGIILPLKIDWVGYKPGDAVTVAASVASMDNQLVVLRRRNLDPATGAVTFTARTETTAKHAYCLGQTTTPPPTPALATTDRTALLLPGISASWSAVTGPGRPEDGATRNVYRSTYAAGTTYAAGDMVSYGGAVWTYVNATPASGHAPPVLPTTSNAWWSLFVEASDPTTAAAIERIQSDGWLSRSEKPEIIRAWMVISDEAATLGAQADTYGVVSEKTTWANARGALSSYLSSLTPAWNDTSQDTAITAATFNGKFTDYFAAKALLLKAIDLAQKSITNGLISSINAIGSDNVLSRGEKPEIMRTWQAINDEAFTLGTQADTYSVVTEKATWASVRNALATYLSGLSPAWNDTSQDTPVIAATFNGKFTDYFYAKADLLRAIDLAQKGITNGLATAIASIAADGTLSRGEKSDIIREMGVITDEAYALGGQSDALGIVAEKTVWANKRIDLQNYLGGLSPAWNDTSQDTAIDPTLFRGRFNDYYYARTLLINAMTAAANQTVGVPNRIKLSQWEAGTAGWQKINDPNGSGSITTGTFQAKPYINITFTPTAGGQAFSVGSANTAASRFKVTPGETLAVFCGANAYGGSLSSCSIFIYYYDGNGAQVSGGGQVGAAGSGSAGFDTTIGGIGGNAVVPAGAVTARIEIYATSSGSSGGTPQGLSITRPFVGQVSQGSTILPTFVPGPNSLDGADVTGQNTAGDTAKVNGILSATITADIATAKSTADTANLAAGQAKAFADDVANDSKFSKDEKKRYIALVNQWASDVPSAVINGQSLGLIAEANALNTAWSNFYGYLVSVGYNNLSTSTSISRSTFQSYAQAFTNAEQALAVACDAYQLRLSQQTTATIFTDPTFARLSSSEWSQVSFANGSYAEYSGDGRRINFIGGGGSVLKTATVPVTTGDRIDLSIDVYYSSNAAGYGGAIQVWAEWLYADGSGMGIYTNLMSYTPGTLGYDFWNASISGNPGKAVAPTGAAGVRLYIQATHGAGNIYVRNPRAAIVPLALQKIGPNGRATNGTFLPTNWNLGLKAVNQNGFALTQTNAGGSVTINIAASSYLLDSGQSLYYPSGSIGGLGFSSAYVFWRNDPNLDGGFSYGVSTDVNDALGTGKVYLGSFTTMNSGGSGGGGSIGGGSGGGGGGTGYCPEVGTPILMANDTRDGPGETRPAGMDLLGAWVWSRHEQTGRWGAYRIVRSDVIEADVMAAPGYPRATGSHPWWLGGRWTEMAEIGRADGIAAVWSATVDDAHTYVVVGADGGWLLSHNKLPLPEDP